MALGVCGAENARASPSGQTEGVRRMDGPARSGVFFGLHRLVATLFRVWAETTFVLARICTQIMPGTEGTVCACRLIAGSHRVWGIDGMHLIAAALRCGAGAVLTLLIHSAPWIGVGCEPTSLGACLVAPISNPEMGGGRGLG